MDEKNEPEPTETKEPKPLENLGKIRWLKQSLLLSAFLNLIFLGIFFYFLVKENPFPFEFEYSVIKMQEIPPFSNRTLLKEYDAFKFDQLVQGLKKKEKIEDGYLERDLALGYLATRHHFDIKRALAKTELASRKMEEITLFPGLQDGDFETIFAFLAKEKWPFTTQGLFQHLKQIGYEKDNSLVQAFLQTPEFQMVETLFQDSKIPIKKRWLLLLLLDGNIEMLETYFLGQKKELNLNEAKRAEFLVQYLEKGSKTAASLLLLLDWDFALHRLDDCTLVLLLDLLPKESKKTLQFANEILNLPRSDLIYQKARSIRGEEPKEIAHIRPPRASIGNLRPVFRDKPPSAPAPNQHVIKNGESLWSIAHKYKVSIEEIQRENRLQSTTIRPGKTLKIPSP